MYSKIESSPYEKTISKIKSPLHYLKTRKAIKKGDPLYKYTREQIELNQLLKPWTYNFTKAFLSIMPTIFILGVMDFFIFSGAKNSIIKDEFLLFSMQLNLKYNATYIYPFIITLLANTASFSITKDRSDKLERQKNTYLYLYLDGTYGLFPQATLILLTNILRKLCLERYNYIEYLILMYGQVTIFLLCFSFLACAFIWLIYVSYLSIPIKMITLNFREISFLTKIKILFVYNFLIIFLLSLLSYWSTLIIYFIYDINRSLF